MKIAYITTDYNKTGGIERVVRELTLRMGRTHEIHVFAHSWDPSCAGEAVFHRVPVLIQKPLFMKWINFFISSALQVQQHEFDIVHAHCPTMTAVDVVTAHSVHKVGVNALIANERSVWGKCTKWLRNGYPLIMPVAAYNFKPGKAAAVISVSEGLTHELQTALKVDKQRIVTIPNGVNLKEFTCTNFESNRKEIRDSLSIDADRIVVIFAGNEFNRKGLEYVIRAIGLLKARNITLLVAGETSDKPGREYYTSLTAELGIRDQVHFVGRTSSIAKYFCAADIFVLPTLYESFGLVSYEAAACGLPLLVTKVNGTGEILKDGYNGWNIERSSEDIAKKIELLIENEKYEEFGKRSARLVESFDWENIVRRTEQLYEEIVKRKHGKNN
jgi:UDP-glucose:(heptosyl)LPS alpha-1,3-glucosyltransferase